MSLRVKRRLVRLATHGGVILALLVVTTVGSLAESAGISGVFALILIGYIATLRINPLPRLLEQRLIREAECEFCGEISDLMGVWSCGCGFVTWQPRHGLSACPNCHKEYEWIQCQRCDASIKT